MKSDYTKYIISNLLFGLNGYLASHILLSSYEIVLFRTLIGGLFLIAMFLLTKNQFTFYREKRSRCFLVISGVSMGTSWLFLYEAYQRIGVSIASLCYYCGPVIVMALSPVLFKERLTWVKVTGFLAVLVGIFLINIQALTEGKNLFGIACGLLSAVMYASMVIFNKKSTGIVGMENSALQLVFACITVSAFVVYRQGVGIDVPPASIPWILLLGVVGTGVGCYLYFTTIGRLPVQSVAVIGYLEALSAVVFSVLLLHEHMGPAQILGGICIIGGAIWSEGLLLKKSHA